jgi:hypothetical protein
MFHDQIAHSIERAHPSKLDYLARLIWQGHAAGALGDDQAQLLAEALEARRTVSPARQPSAMQSVSGATVDRRWPKPRRQQSPDKAVSIARRRRLAASGPLPPTLACRFTVCELAVLRLIGDHLAQCYGPVEANSPWRAQGSETHHERPYGRTSAFMRSRP